MFNEQYLKTKYLSLFVLVLFAIILFPFDNAEAKQIVKTGEEVTIAKDEIVDGSLIIAAENLMVHGKVNGDIVAIAGEVLIDGTVDGDLLIVAGSVKVSGTVNGSVRVCCGEVFIDGEVENDLTLSAARIEIFKDAKIDGDIAAVAGTVAMYGGVSHGAQLRADNVLISSQIGGDVNIVTTDLKLTPSAIIKGNLEYKSEHEALIESGALIEGETTYTKSKHHPLPGSAWVDVFIGATVTARIVGALAAMLIGIIMVKFFPIHLRSTSTFVHKKTWTCVGLGLVAVIVTPFIGIILFLTLVGIPLAIIIGMVYFVVIYISKIYLMYLLGSLLLSRRSIFSGDMLKNAMANVCIGAGIYLVLSLVPFIGAIVGLFALLVGTGAFMLQMMDVHAAKSGRKLFA